MYDANLPGPKTAKGVLGNWARLIGFSSFSYYLFLYLHSFFFLKNIPPFSEKESKSEPKRLASNSPRVVKNAPPSPYLKTQPCCSIALSQIQELKVVFTAKVSRRWSDCYCFVPPVNVCGQDQCTGHSPGLRERPGLSHSDPCRKLARGPSAPLDLGPLCSPELLSPKTFCSLMTLRYLVK